MNIILANVLMTANRHDHGGVRALARELGVTYSLDPTITPKIDGDRSILNLRVSGSELNQLFHEDDLVGDAEQYCAPPPPPGEDEMQALPCHAGHTTIYISPYGDVFPCVQFPLPSGNVRRQKFIDIWQNSSALKDVRSIRVKDLPVCSTCSHAAHVRVVQGWPTWKGICAGLLLPTAKSPISVREFHPQTCCEWAERIRREHSSKSSRLRS